MHIDKKKTIKISIVVVSVLLFLSFGLFLTYKYWSPLGKKLKINFAIKDGKITSTQTQDQNDNFAIPAQIINSTTTRFTMDVKSNKIESVTAKLKFKTGPREIKLGVRGNEKDKFAYQPFYQKTSQECDWDKLEEEGQILFQKVKKYDNIGQLINDPPDYRQIASYYIHPSILMQKLLANDIDQKNQKPIDIKTGLRGTHTFMVRVDQSPFVFKLTKQDINMYPGEDKYIISISRDGKLIEEKSIADDGFIGTEKLKKDSQSVEFNLTDIEPGIYEVNAKNESNGADSIITQIESNQSKLVIKAQVFTLFNKPIILYTNSSPLTLQIYHKDYLQTVKLNDTILLKIKKEVEKYVFDLEQLVKNKKSGEFYKLETLKTDVIFNSSGYFAFAPEQYFDPEVIHTTNLNAVASLDEIDYILTSVPKARQEGNWLVSEVTFDPKDIKLDENKKLYFSLEMPDLATYGGELEINSFEAKVSVAGIFTEKISSFFTESYQKIKSFFINSFNKIHPREKQPAKSVSGTGTPTPAEINKSVKVTIFNGGAPEGYAKKYADLLKNTGYINIETGNTPKDDFKNAQILYPLKFESEAIDIEKILKEEYETVTQIVDNESVEITITLGAK
jgi:hypothetical protein